MVDEWVKRPNELLGLLARRSAPLARVSGWMKVFSGMRKNARVGEVIGVAVMVLLPRLAT